MSDRMRGALFNVLGDIEGLRVLDAFAGSGALALEAVSRGAERVVAVESDGAAQRAIAQNIADLQVGNHIKLVRATANAWLQTTEGDLFDIILCDPPYHDTQQSLLKRLAGRAKPHGGVVVFSLPPGQKLMLPPDFTPHSTRRYGDAQLVFFVRA